MKEFFKNLLSSAQQTKDFLISVREILFISILILFFAKPSYIRGKLKDLGVKTVDAGIFKIDISEAEAKSLSEIEKKRFALGDSVKLAQQIRDSVTSPVEKAKYTQVINALQEKQADYKKFDQLFKKNIIAQVKQAELNNEVSVPQEGWIYLGKVAEDKKRWDNAVNKTTNATASVLDIGQNLTIVDDVYLRKDDGHDFQHAQSAITSVLKSSDNIVVMDTSYSHAAKGGWFMWAKVKKL